MDARREAAWNRIYLARVAKIWDTILRTREEGSIEFEKTRTKCLGIKGVDG